MRQASAILAPVDKKARVKELKAELKALLKQLKKVEAELARLS